MTMFPDQSEKILENLRIINSRFDRKDKTPAKRGIHPILFAGPTALFSLPGQAFVEVGRLRFHFKQPSNILSVWAACNVAPTGADMIIDLNMNGVSVFANPTQRPLIPAGGNMSQEAIPTTILIPVDSYLTADIDQVGSALPGGDVTVMVRLGGST